MKKMVLALLVCMVSGADAQNKRAQLDGVWILSGSATIEMMLTPAGEAARARYDYLRDDPAMQCIPASFTRVMSSIAARTPAMWSAKSAIPTAS